MELFSKLERNSKSVEFMKVWLIEQRGISGWGTSNLTSSSIYCDTYPQEDGILG